MVEPKKINAPGEDYEIISDFKRYKGPAKISKRLVNAIPIPGPAICAVKPMKRAMIAAKIDCACDCTERMLAIASSLDCSAT